MKKTVESKSPFKPQPQSRSIAPLALCAALLACAALSFADETPPWERLMEPAEPDMEAVKKAAETPKPQPGAGGQAPSTAADKKAQAKAEKEKAELDKKERKKREQEKKEQEKRDKERQKQEKKDREKKEKEEAAEPKKQPEPAKAETPAKPAAAPKKQPEPAKTEAPAKPAAEPVKAEAQPKPAEQPAKAETQPPKPPEPASKHAEPAKTAKSAEPAASDDDDASAKPAETPKPETAHKPTEPAAKPAEPVKKVEAAPKPAEPAKVETAPKPAEPAKVEAAPKPADSAKKVDAAPKPAEPAKKVDAAPKPAEPVKKVDAAPAAPAVVAEPSAPAAEEKGAAREESKSEKKSGENKRQTDYTVGKVYENSGSRIGLRAAIGIGGLAGHNKAVFDREIEIIEVSKRISKDDEFTGKMLVTPNGTDSIFYHNDTVSFGYEVTLRSSLSGSVSVALLSRINAMLGVSCAVQYSFYVASGKYVANKDDYGETIKADYWPVSEVTVELQSLEIPLLLRINAEEALGYPFYAEIGPQFGFNMYARREEYYGGVGGKTGVNIRKPANLNVFAIGPVISAGLDLDRISIDLRAHIGLIKYQEDEGGKPWSITVGLTSNI